MLILYLAEAREVELSKVEAIDHVVTVNELLKHRFSSRGIVFVRSQHNIH